MSDPVNGIALLRAIKGVVAGELGTTRRVVGKGGQPLCVYSPAILEVENPIEDRAFFNAGHWFDIRIGDQDADPANPLSLMGNRGIDDLIVSIELLSSGGQGDDYSIVLQGGIIDVGTKIRNALSFPRNLTVDDRGQQTGLVDGALRGPGNQPKPRVVRGERECHLQRWRVQCVAVLDLLQET